MIQSSSGKTRNDEELPPGVYCRTGQLEEIAAAATLSALPGIAWPSGKMTATQRYNVTPESQLRVTQALNVEAAGLTEEMTASLFTPLEHAPGLEFLVYGKSVSNDGKKTGKEGSWDHPKFKRQLVGVLDACDFLPRYQDCQIVLQIDNSSGHGAGASDALNVMNMAGGFGGTQAIPHGVILRAEDIGPKPAIQTLADGTTVDVKLVASDEQHFAYDVTRRDPRTNAVIGEQPLPPFDKPNAPRVDVVVNGKQKEGFEGKAKGIKQILFESGWYKPGMVLQMSLADLNDPQKNPKGRTKEMLMKHVLSQRPDFLAELTDLEKLLNSRGHALVMSVSTGCCYNRPFPLSCLLLPAVPYVPP